MPSYVTAYLNRLRLGSYRPASVAVKARGIAALERSLPDGVTLLTLSRFDLEAFLSRDLKATTRRFYLSTFRGLYAFLVEEGLRADDPTVRLPAVKSRPGEPRPIDRKHLHRALQHGDQRMRCYLLLMALAGLRACEVARLRPEDLLVREDDTLLFLRETKGGHAATVPAHPVVLEALRGLPVREDGLWWSVRPETVSQHVNAHLKALGIPSTGHALRHFAGTTWLTASGNDLLATANLLRHRNVATTQVYTQLSAERPAAIVARVEFDVA